MLDIETFGLVVKNTPLVSIDLCVIYEKSILLAKRTNEPLKSSWCTPGGRIYKNEPYVNAIKRIAKCEIGFCAATSTDFKLLGIWDHFYENSFIDQAVSTHYLNLGFYLVSSQKPKIYLDHQHSESKWTEIVGVLDDPKIHDNVKNYARKLELLIN